MDTLDTPISKEPISRKEEIINHPERQFIYSSPSEFFQGSLNPLNTRVITKTLNIDTRFRDNIYTTKCTDFTINLPVKFSKVVSMQLAALEFPVTFYGISEELGNNFIYIQVNYNALDDSGEVLDASGTYTGGGQIQVRDNFSVTSKKFNTSTAGGNGFILCKFNDTHRLVKM